MITAQNGSPRSCKLYKWFGERDRKPSSGQKRPPNINGYVGNFALKISEDFYIYFLHLNSNGRLLEFCWYFWILGTSNLQRSALGEIKNTRSQSVSSNQEAKTFKQPQKPTVTRKTKEKENVAAPEPVKNDAVESMDISNPVMQLVSRNVVPIEDIDIEDAGNPQLVVEYVQDIYNYLR